MRKRCEDFTVGWLCAIDTELLVACKLLDNEYGPDQRPSIDRKRDANVYVFGCMCGHDVVIVCLPMGRIGAVPAATIAERMKSSFPSLQFGLLVGIAGAAPTDKTDICLGDVVISSPKYTHPGVIQYDYGKTIQEKSMELTGSLSPPPEVLRQGLSHLNAKCKGGELNLKQEILDMVEKYPGLEEYNLPAHQLDILCHSSYLHKEKSCECKITDSKSFPEVMNPPYRWRIIRAQPVIHYGLIASASNVLRDAILRDTLAEKHNILCFEMEAAGLMDSFPCIVIRGMSDYADTHKDKDKIWQPYAAAVAAVCAKELLQVIPVYETATTVAATFSPQPGVATLSTEIINYEYDKDGRVSRLTRSQTSSHPSLQQMDNNNNNNESLYRTISAPSRTYEEPGHDFRAPMSQQERVEPQQSINAGIHHNFSEIQTVPNISETQKAFDNDFDKLETYNAQFHSNEESKAEFTKIVQGIKLRLKAVLLANGRRKNEQSRPHNPSSLKGKSLIPRIQANKLNSVDEDSGIGDIDLASNPPENHNGSRSAAHSKAVAHRTIHRA